MNCFFEIWKDTTPWVLSPQGYDQLSEIICFLLSRFQTFPVPPRAPSTPSPLRDEPSLAHDQLSSLQTICVSVLVYGCPEQSDPNCQSFKERLGIGDLAQW